MARFYEQTANLNKNAKVEHKVLYSNLCVCVCVLTLTQKQQNKINMYTCVIIHVGKMT